MNNPDLYSKCNAMTRVAAIQCLDEHAGKMNWKLNGDTVIDVGCGDGSVTRAIKKHILCKHNYTKFVACDISEDMVRFASSRDGDERTVYMTYDIAQDVPYALKHNFNHVFSFFTLHWIQDQEKVFSNIFDILTEGGDCLLSILGYTPIYNLFNNIGCTSKWSSSWLKDLNRFISPYYEMENMEARISKMLEAIGFTDIEVKNNKMSYTMENGMELKNTIKAVEPYHMPPDVFDDFMRDCLVVGQDMGLLEPTEYSIEDYNKKIEYTYNLIVICAKKPCKINS